jgi:hypothetical protein
MYEFVRSRIGQMESGEFENLARIVLPLDNKNYEKITDTLNVDGKTTPGPVDLYVYKKDTGKYAAISCTTQKSNIVKKIKEDIIKLNDTATKFRELIDEVVVCVNTPIRDEDAEYRDLCNEYGWEYSPYSLSRLSSTVTEHPKVADKLCANLLLDSLTRLKERDGDMIKAHIEKEYGLTASDQDVSSFINKRDKTYLCGKRVADLRDDIGISRSWFIDLIEFNSEVKLGEIEENKIEVTSAEIDSICDKTGCSRMWLTHDEGWRYEFEEIYTSDLSKVDYIKSLMPKNVYVLLNRDDMRLILLAHIQAYNWKMFSFSFALNFWNWWGDEHHITHIYELFSAIQNDFGITVSGRYISSDDYKECVSGMVHPSQIIESTDKSGKHWFEDILDVDHKSGMAPRYAEVYGEWFVKAQDYFRSNRP